MDKVVSKDGTEIAYERTGDGPPVIVVGGATADHHADAEVAAALSANFTVITYDRRGRGESGDTQPYDVPREVEDIEALIDVAGGSAYLYGQSSGAALCLVAVASGAPVTRLAAFEPPYRVADAPQLPERYVATLEELTSTGRRGDAVAYFMTAAVGQPADEVEQMRQAPFWAALEAIAHTLAYDGRVLDGDSKLPVDVLAKVSVPTLAIDSNGSPNWLRAATEATAKAVPNTEHRSLDGTFHTVATEVLAPVLKEFFLR